METAFLAEIATIVGAVSILLTLVFVVIELKNNATQARAANIASRDQQYSQFMRYWFEEENFALVQKGRKDYGALNDKENRSLNIILMNVSGCFLSASALAKYLLHHNSITRGLKSSSNIRAVSNAISI